MDKVLWLDGRTTVISWKDSYENQYFENDDWHMNYSNSKFVWRANCWMEV